MGKAQDFFSFFFYKIRYPTDTTDDEVDEFVNENFNNANVVELADMPETIPAGKIYIAEDEEGGTIYFGNSANEKVKHSSANGLLDASLFEIDDMLIVAEVDDEKVFVSIPKTEVGGGGISGERRFKTIIDQTGTGHATYSDVMINTMGAEVINSRLTRIDVGTYTLAFDDDVINVVKLDVRMQDLYSSFGGLPIGKLFYSKDVATASTVTIYTYDLAGELADELLVSAILDITTYD